jgi:hypothetical protein
MTTYEGRHTHSPCSDDASSGDHTDCFSSFWTYTYTTRRQSSRSEAARSSALHARAAKQCSPVDPQLLVEISSVLPDGHTEGRLDENLQCQCTHIVM